MKENFVAGFTLTISGCTHVAHIKVSEVEGAEFDTSNDRISVRYTGVREILSGILPLPDAMMRLLSEHGLSESIDHVTACGKTNTQTIYIASLEELRVVLEFEVLPSMLPDFVDNDEFEMQELHQCFRDEIPTLAKHLTKSVRAELAKLRVMDEVD